MNPFRVESVSLNSSPEKAFVYIAEPKNLPKWTHAFKSAWDGKATMITPAGEVEVDLKVNASAAEGTIDWHMTFPDGSAASAYSRVLPASSGKSVYSFVLMAPPVPLEQLEGTLDQQARILRHELETLSTILGKA